MLKGTFKMSLIISVSLVNAFHSEIENTHTTLERQRWLVNIKTTLIQNKSNSVITPGDISSCHCKKQLQKCLKKRSVWKFVKTLSECYVQFLYSRGECWQLQAITEEAKTGREIHFSLFRLIHLDKGSNLTLRIVCFITCDSYCFDPKERLNKTFK